MPKKRPSRKSVSNAQRNKIRAKERSVKKVKSTKPKQTFAEEWGSKPADYTIGKDAAKDLLKKLRTSTVRRVQSLKKNRSFSYALFQLEQSLEKTYFKGTLPDLEKMTWPQVERELRMYHQFWAAKTASTEGARKEQVEQSKRIWGVDKFGKPNRLMTFDESKEYWKAHDEFQNLYRGQLARYDSNRIQQALGMSMGMNANWGDEDFDLVATLKDAMEILHNQEEMSQLYGYDFQDFNPAHPNREFIPGQFTKKSMEVFRANGYDFDY